MVDKVARLHFQHASPAGALRMLSGWLIAVTGLALLVAQLVRSVEGFELAVSGAVAGGRFRIMESEAGGRLAGSRVASAVWVLTARGRARA